MKAFGSSKLSMVLALSTALLVSSSPIASAADQTTNNTSVLQGQVLTKINQGLSRGSISPEQATSLKTELNTISEHETIYESYGLPNPEALVQKDITDLNTLNAKVDQTLTLRQDSNKGSVNVMHRDIHKMIGDALTSNKITNAQAEDYYSRLAQIENDMESLKNDPASSQSDMLALNKNLQELRTDIQKHSSNLITKAIK